MDTPDCSTEGSIRSGTTLVLQPSRSNEARLATNTTCGLSRSVTLAVVFRLNEEELILELARRGTPLVVLGTNSSTEMMRLLLDKIGQSTVTESVLSREVSLAVLPRLNTGELLYELDRRGITPAPGDSRVGLMKRLCDEVGKEYFSRQASSLNVGNNTRNTPTQEVPTGAEETSQAAPVQETPSGAMATAAAEEEETDNAEPTEAKQKRKQAQDKSIEPSSKRSNRGEEAAENTVEQDQEPGTGLGAGSSAPDPTGMSNLDREHPIIQYSITEISRANSPNYFPCPVEGCGYTGRSRGNLHQHIIGRHAEEKSYVCDVCGFRTAWKGSLKNHRNTHR
ncbi:uncharacterized protein LOC144904281 [Branchiostoma floridae x Branchiostoma belcheri]